MAVRESAGGRGAPLRGRRYGNGGIGDAVPRFQRVSAQRPEQVVGRLREPTFTARRRILLIRLRVV